MADDMQEMVNKLTGVVAQQSEQLDELRALVKKLASAAEGAGSPPPPPPPLEPYLAPPPGMLLLPETPTTGEIPVGAFAEKGAPARGPSTQSTVACDADGGSESSMNTDVVISAGVTRRGSWHAGMVSNPPNKGLYAGGSRGRSKAEAVLGIVSRPLPCPVSSFAASSAEVVARRRLVTPRSSRRRNNKAATHRDEEDLAVLSSDDSSAGSNFTAGPTLDVYPGDLSTSVPSGGRGAGWQEEQDLGGCSAGEPSMLRGAGYAAFNGAGAAHGAGEEKRGRSSSRGTAAGRERGAGGRRAKQGSLLLDTEREDTRGTLVRIPAPRCIILRTRSS